MDYFIFFLSFVMLFLGGEFLVRSSVAIALRMNISTLVVGMTVVSFATSSPELFISISAAFSSMENATDIIFGNIIGSNIANITLVLGLMVMVHRIKISKQTIIINYPAMLLISAVFGCTLYWLDGINQITGIVFVFMLFVFCWLLIRRSRKKKHHKYKKNINFSAINDVSKPEIDFIPLYVPISQMILGIALLGFGSEYLVNGIEKVANNFLISERVISITIVAIGTSIPELATSLVASFRKQTDLAIGNLFGSNIFNILAVLGITSIIRPIELSHITSSDFLYHPLMNDYFWMLGCILLLGIFIYILSRKKLDRIEGLLLFISYILFMYFLLK